MYLAMAFSLAVSLPTCLALRVESQVAKLPPFVITDLEYANYRKTSKGNDPFNIQNDPRGRLGNQLQRLVNQLMYAISKGYDTADVSQVKEKQAKGIGSILNLPDLITLSDAAELHHDGVLVPDGCLGGWRDSCNVSISYRYKISQQLLTPHLTCPPNDESAGSLVGASVRGLSIHLRNVETWAESYRQPPCAMYADVIENSSFNNVKVIMGGSPPPWNKYQPGPEEPTQELAFPCRSRIVDACEKRSPPCSVEVYDNRSLADDACDVVMAQNLVLSRGTFGDNLFLLGPRRTSLFAMVPCFGCKSDAYQYLQTEGTGGNHFQYRRDMCDAFGDAFVGYEAPKKYVNYGFRKGTWETRSRKSWMTKMSEMMMDFGIERVSC